MKKEKEAKGFVAATCISNRCFPENSEAYPKRRQGSLENKKTFPGEKTIAKAASKKTVV